MSEEPAIEGLELYCESCGKVYYFRALRSGEAATIAVPTIDCCDAPKMGRRHKKLTPQAL